MKDGDIKHCDVCNDLLTVKNRVIATKGVNNIFYKGVCITCHRAKTTERYHLRKKYPKPDSSYVCPICFESGRKLNLDHDWDTGNFRGWLCGRCNNALGMLKDDVVVLKRAIDYLKKTKGK